MNKNDLLTFQGRSWSSRAAAIFRSVVVCIRSDLRTHGDLLFVETLQKTFDFLWLKSAESQLGDFHPWFCFVLDYQ